MTRTSIDDIWRLSLKIWVTNGMRTGRDLIAGVCRLFATAVQVLMMNLKICAVIVFKSVTLEWNSSLPVKMNLHRAIGSLLEGDFTISVSSTFWHFLIGYT